MNEYMFNIIVSNVEILLAVMSSALYSTSISENSNDEILPIK